MTTLNNLNLKGRFLISGVRRGQQARAGSANELFLLWSIFGGNGTYRDTTVERKSVERGSQTLAVFMCPSRTELCPCGIVLSVVPDVMGQVRGSFSLGLSFFGFLFHEYFSFLCCGRPPWPVREISSAQSGRGRRVKQTSLRF